MSASNIPKYVFFSPNILITTWFGTSNTSDMYRLWFLWLGCRIFLCQIPFLYLDCIFSPFLLEFPNLFRFLEKCLMSSMYIKWLIFSYDLLSSYPAVHFLSISLSGIMYITNSIVRVHPPGIYLFGSLHLLSFVLLQSIPLSRFAWSFR